jgi:hypothetical protein
MKLSELLKEAKKDYLAVKPPERVTTYGWLELREKLDKKFSLREFLFWFLVRPAFATALSILLLTGFAGAVLVSAQNSLPGETLYPVKRISEDVVASVTGSKMIKLEGRAQEIIILSQKEDEDSDRLKESVIEYEVTVAKVEAKVEEEEKKDIEETLEKHKSEFERIYESSKSKEEIRKAIEATRIEWEERETEREEENWFERWKRDWRRD